MVRYRNLILLFVLIVVIIATTKLSLEGFYSDTNISTASSNLTTFTTGPLANLKTVLTDMSNRQYSLDLVPSIKSLNMALASDSSGIKKNNAAMSSVQQSLASLSTIQSNTILVNDAIAKMLNTTVSYTNVDSSNSVVPILTAITQLNQDVQAIQSRLGQLPDK
jgi:hypothetical protein